jgi:hypothetical protein
MCECTATTRSEPQRAQTLRLLLGALRIAEHMLDPGAEPVLLDADLDAGLQQPSLGYTRKQGMLGFRPCWGPPQHIIQPIDRPFMQCSRGEQRAVCST